MSLFVLYNQLARLGRRANGAIVVALLAAAFGASATRADAQQRGMVPADLSRLRPIWLSSLSPDGRHVALIVGRDRTIRSGYFGRRNEFNMMCDVWVVPTDGGPAINVTQGDRNGGSSWLLQWSPKGTRLAALTTQGSTDRVRLLSWTVGQKAGVVHGQDAVYTETRARRSGSGGNGPVAWLNEDDLVFVAVDVKHDATTMQVATEAWRRSLTGKDVTSSVLDSAAIKNRPPQRWSKLKKLHVPNSRTTTVASIPPEFQRQTSLGLEVSPTGRHVAVTGDIGPNAVPATVAMSADNERRRRIGILSLDGAESDAPIAWAAGIAGPRDASVSWSPDGSRVAVFGKELPDANASSDPITPSSALFVIGVGQRVQTITLEGRRASSAEWADAGRLLVLSRTSSSGGGGAGEGAARQDWWLVDVAGTARTSLTTSLKSVPATLMALADGRYIGLAQGAWVAIDASGAQVLEGGEVSPRSITWPQTGGVARGNSLIVQADAQKPEAGQAAASADASPPAAASARYFRVDIDGTRVRMQLLDRPADSRFVGFHKRDDGAGVGVFTGSTSNGTYVWTIRDGQAPAPIFTNNEFIAEIASGEQRMIEFRNGDGVSLKAALHLPPGYKEGTKVPVLVWVYGGTTVTGTNFLQGKSSAAFFNTELFAAKGVAVLYPSIPMSPYGATTGEPVTEITKSVLPAIDRLIEMGIADPQRLAVAGNSYGAYATYALLTQTSRFKAAIAADGDANLFTSYTSLDGVERYLDGAAETREGVWWAEASQGRMGTTPWRDQLRYLRNSPFFALDRITTPLLIVHGDLDYVPIAHAEEMFVGLNRLGKTARFVRYFGERHGTHSPANLQDMWVQIYRWLDEYLLPDKSGAAATAAPASH